MDSVPDLKQHLSMRFEEELNRHLLPDESVLVSLPGSFGEAFVVTSRRAYVIREQEGGSDPGCTVYSYLLGNLTGAQAIASDTGGMVELKLQTAQADIETARVYFPSYDMDKFRSAAEFVSGLISGQAPATPAPSSVEAAAVGGACPKCGAPVGDESPFCPGCGAQTRSVCAHCGSAYPSGAKFCGHCGKEALEFTPACPQCGSRIARWQAYCTECGSVLQTNCLACGSTVLPGYKHCIACGRLLGSNRLDAQAARAAHQRLQEFRDRQVSPADVRRPEPAAQPPAVAASAATKTAAEEHNRRGQECFEEGDLEEAIREFQLAVSLAPGNGSYHCNLAIAYDEDSQDEEALSEYQQALALDPNDLTALLSLGYMYNENNQSGEAQKVWQRILEIAPLSAEAQEVKENMRYQEDL